MIPLAFLFLLILIIWLIIGSRGHWFLKLMMLGISLVFATMVFVALNSFKGYCLTSSWEALSGQKALLLSYRVREPTPQLNDLGEIFLWIIPFKIDTTYFAYHPLREEPRAYSLPYRRSAQKSLASMKRAEDGSMMIQFGEKQNKQAGKADNTGSMSIGAGEIYQLPPPKLPEKNQ